MKLIAPSYYPQFSCIAERCVHSCCIGWEIDIDPATAAAYRRIDGDIGRRLRENIAYSDNGDTYFALSGDERCPFLNADGLCDLILTLGENSLCQICRDHPRFRNHFSDHTEIGLGMCCEAAASLILEEQEPVTWITLEDDGHSLLPQAEEAAFYQQREALIAIAQDRSRSLPVREDAILSAVNRPLRPMTPLTAARLYEPLERLDDAWSEQLQRLHDTAQTATSPTVPEVMLEQLLVYFLTRHLPGALEDGRLEARAAFAVHATRLLRLLNDRQHGDTETFKDLARLYSAEIEYSDENLDELLTFLDITPPR